MALAGLVLVAMLARGPVVLGGQYLGVHFLALGCVLTLTGFNIVHLGVLAKVIAASQIASFDSRLSRWALNAFTLEGGLIAGLLMFLLGLGIDGWILWQWLAHHGGPQDETVHVAFVATLLIVLGINIIFSSFLLSMFASDHRKRLTDDGAGATHFPVGPGGGSTPTFRVRSAVARR
jgi:uncharacterized membrane protein